jgi:hypothetical protein
VNATFWAVMIARDVDACRALLRGEPVDPERLDPDWLSRAKEARLVTLDVLAIDLLGLDLPCREPVLDDEGRPE